jgi:hypothetical protein
LTPRRFAALLAALTASLARVAFIESHPDEDACMTIGWLLSRGVKLYTGVFSHHFPLDYLPPSVLAAVFGPSATAMRAFMILAWAAAAAGVFALLRRSPDGARAAALFAVLSSQWLTYWQGQMMLVENYWGAATVLALAALGSPLGLEPAPTPRRAAAFGAAAALVLTASPTCLPAAALLAGWFAADRRWRALWRPAALGAAAWLLLLAAWAAPRVGWSLLWQDAVVFNRDVYARFTGIEGGAIGGFWRRALGYNVLYFGSTLDGAGAEGWFEGLIKLAALSWAAWSLARRRWTEGAWKLAFLLAVHARPERNPYAPPIHAAPFYLVAALVLSAGLARAWGAFSGRRRAALAVAAAAALLPTLWATALATSSLRVYAAPNPAYDRIVAAVRSCTAPEDRVLALPCAPRFYLDAARAPATPSVFYLPWQEAWPPQRAATMDALERLPPKVVLIRDPEVWGIPWTRYGRDVDARLKSARYAEAASAGAPSGPDLLLLVRPDAAPAFAACAAGVLRP